MEKNLQPEYNFKKPTLYPAELQALQEIYFAIRR